MVVKAVILQLRARDKGFPRSRFTPRVTRQIFPEDDRIGVTLGERNVKMVRLIPLDAAEICRDISRVPIQ